MEKQRYFTMKDTKSMKGIKPIRVFLSPVRPKEPGFTRREDPVFRRFPFRASAGEKCFYFFLSRVSVMPFSSPRDIISTQIRCYTKINPSHFD